jgi:hypothetical protein
MTSVLSRAKITHRTHATVQRLDCSGIDLSRRRLFGSKSKDIDCRKLWLGAQAVPQVDSKPNIAGNEYRPRPSWSRASRYWAMAVIAKARARSSHIKSLVRR